VTARVALGFLTRLPVGGAPLTAQQLSRAAVWFPAVGLLVGGVMGGVRALAGLALDPAPATLLGLMAAMLVTGALHEDGLADTADGFGGGSDRERKLAIMRDSTHGTYGVVALVLSIGLRATAIATIRDPVFVGLALVGAHAASRAALPAAMFLLRPARADGLGAAAGRPSRIVAAAAALIGAAIALATLGPLALLLAGGSVALAGMLARRQIGGYTGDVLGFFQQIGEIVMLLVAAR
jgi:adenosylcobinamide-GDP ribazoletransferase